jgi:hypothetical protein
MKATELKKGMKVRANCTYSSILKPGDILTVNYNEGGIFSFDEKPGYAFMPEWVEFRGIDAFEPYEETPRVEPATNPFWESV